MNRRTYPYKSGYPGADLELSHYKVAFRGRQTLWESARAPIVETFRLRDLPLEIQERVFGQVLLEENDHDTCNWLGRNGELSLLLGRIRPPVLARVNHQLRADFLDFFFRTMIFRLDIEMAKAAFGVHYGKFDQRPKTVEWLRSLDSKNALSLRKLQFRLETPDVLGKRANVMLEYGTRPARWTYEVVIDQGWLPDEYESSPERVQRIVPRPNEAQTFPLQDYLQKQLGESQETGFGGMGWPGIHKVATVLADWSRTYGYRFRYVDIERVEVHCSNEASSRAWIKD